MTEQFTLERLAVDLERVLTGALDESFDDAHEVWDETARLRQACRFILLNHPCKFAPTRLADVNRAFTIMWGSALRQHAASEAPDLKLAASDVHGAIRRIRRLLGDLIEFDVVRRAPPQPPQPTVPPVPPVLPVPTPVVRDVPIRRVPGPPTIQEVMAERRRERAA